MEIEGLAYLRPNGGLFQARHSLKCFVVLVNAWSINVPPSSQGPRKIFISKLFGLPVLVLVASGLKRATHALGSLGISLLFIK